MLTLPGTLYIIDTMLISRATLGRTGLFLLLAATSLSACAAPPAGGPPIQPSQVLAVPANLRNFRYGEVIPVYREGLKLHGEVYNTMGLNDCPAEAWARLDAKALAKAYGAVAVRLNGPRYWVLDSIVAGGSTVTGGYADFGGIQMRRLARVDLRLRQLFTGKASYTPSGVVRTTDYTYLAGGMVYELISPKGEVWRMQSYSQTVDRSQTIADLSTLGARLGLPKGWAYRTRILDSNSVLRAEGLAWVLQDELENSYQKID